jgi:hypothetical protein
VDEIHYQTLDDKGILFFVFEKINEKYRQQ